MEWHRHLQVLGVAVHQQDGKILIFDDHFSSFFLAYLTLFCNFSGSNFYKHTT